MKTRGKELMSRLAMCVGIVVLAAVSFHLGRISTPYCDISEVPSGNYTTHCFAQKDGRVLTLVQEDRSGHVCLVGFDQPLPATFQAADGTEQGGKFQTTVWRWIYDTTGDKPKKFWSTRLRS